MTMSYSLEPATKLVLSLSYSPVKVAPTCLTVTPAWVKSSLYLLNDSMFCPASPITVMVTLLNRGSSAKPVLALTANKASHQGKGLNFIIVWGDRPFKGNVRSGADR